MISDELSVAEKKRELRRQILTLRRALPVVKRMRFSAELAQRLFTLSEWQQANVVGLYASSEDEVQTDVIIQQALKEGKQVVLPRVYQQTINQPSLKLRQAGNKQQTESTPVFSRGRGYLIWHAIKSLADLRQGYAGIREPKSSLPTIDLAELNFLLVPGIAFDEAGNRLGHGKGFYDQVLSTLRSIRQTQSKQPQASRVVIVSLAYPCQLVPEIPVEEWDEKVSKLLV